MDDQEMEGVSDPPGWRGIRNEADDERPPARIESNVIVVRPPAREGQWLSSDDDEYELLLRQEERDVSLKMKLSYGMGHVYNDLCASMWFTYLMVFLEKVIKLQASHAGFLMLVGQVTDAICTPVVGIASDSATLPSCLKNIGRRMFWHIIGTICVTLSFPFIFNECFPCQEHTNEWLRVLWYIPPIMIFQFGWASVQISHLALIPELSHVDSSRRTMNSLRYGGTVLANLFVFALLWYLLKNCSAADVPIDAHDIYHFRKAGFIVVGLGVVSVIPFYAITREPTNYRTFGRRNSITSQISQISQASALSRMHWTSWFGHIKFYQIALLYMLSRLYMNISQVYMPFYLTETQDLEKEYVAKIPMVSFMSSFMVSTTLSFPVINQRLNKKLLYAIALLVGLGNCIWMMFSLAGWKIYTVAFVLGLAQSVLLVTSLDITADLISTNTETGAFVYGAMSFVDKLANGVAYQIIELVNPSCDESHPEVCASFYRVVMVYIPAGCLVLSIIVLLSLLPADISARNERLATENLLRQMQEESARQIREEESYQRQRDRMSERARLSREEPSLERQRPQTVTFPDAEAGRSDINVATDREGLIEDETPNNDNAQEPTAPPQVEEKHDGIVNPNYEPNDE